MILTYPMPLFSLRDSLVQLLHGNEVQVEDEGASETTLLLESGNGTQASTSPIVSWRYTKQMNDHSVQDERTQRSPAFTEPLHWVLTLALWASSLVLALSVPSLGVVLNLVGCVSGATMAFLLPGLFWAKLSGWTSLAVVLVAIGLLVTCLGSYYAVVESWQHRKLAQ